MKKMRKDRLEIEVVVSSNPLNNIHCILCGRLRNRLETIERVKIHDASSRSKL